MDFQQIELIVTIIIAFSSLILSNYFSQKREIKARKSEIRIKYLLETYRDLEFYAKNKSGKNDPKAFKKAVSEIQLYGNSEEIEAVQKVVLDYGNKKEADLIELLVLIRKDLRKELDLSEEKGKLMFISE